jgi:hypothetical protein
MLSPTHGAENGSGDRPYRGMCVQAVAAALEAEVALELAIAQFVREARTMTAPAGGNSAVAA